MALHCCSLTQKMACGLIMQATGYLGFDLNALPLHFNLRFVFFPPHLIIGQTFKKKKKQFTFTADFVSNTINTYSQSFQIKSFQQMTRNMSGLCGLVGKLGMRLLALILKSLLQQFLKRPAISTDIHFTLFVSIAY